MAKCDRNCFECKFPDCIVDKASPEEREEIRERDNRYFNSNIRSGSIIQSRSKRSKYNGNCRRIIYG